MKQRPKKCPKFVPSKTFANIGIFFFIITWLPAAFFVDNIYIKAGAFILACIIAGGFFGLVWFILENDLDEYLMERAEEALRKDQKNKKEDE